jgi:hypothetical protein
VAQNAYSHSLAEVKAVGITPVFVFHSSNEMIRKNQAEFPWSRNLTYVGDPDKKLYKGTGTETSAMILLKSFTAKQLLPFIFSKTFLMVYWLPLSYRIACE